MFWNSLFKLDKLMGSINSFVVSKSLKHVFAQQEPFNGNSIVIWVIHAVETGTKLDKQGGNLI